MSRDGPRLGAISVYGSTDLSLRFRTNASGCASREDCHGGVCRSDGLCDCPSGYSGADCSYAGSCLGDVVSTSETGNFSSSGGALGAGEQDTRYGNLANCSFSVRVAGAGSGACNGVYAKASVPAGFRSVSHYYQLDANHSVYYQEGSGGGWHIAHLGVEVWYSSQDASPPAGGPPSTGWVLAQGNSGDAPAPASVVGNAGPSITSESSLYLYLRGGPGGGQFMRRKVQLRNTW